MFLVEVPSRLLSNKHSTSITPACIQVTKITRIEYAPGIKEIPSCQKRQTSLCLATGHRDRHLGLCLYSGVFAVAPVLRRLSRRSLADFWEWFPRGRAALPGRDLPLKAFSLEVCTCSRQGPSEGRRFKQAEQVPSAITKAR